MITLFAVLMISIIVILILVLRKRHTKVVTFDPMHISELVKLIVTLGSFITVCITLILLVLQNRTIVTQTNLSLEMAKSQAFGLSTSHTLYADEIFIKNPELRPYFYQGKDIESTDPLYGKVLSTAEFLLDYFDSVKIHLRKFSTIYYAEEKLWDSNAITTFAASPIMCRFLEATKDWYSEDLYKLKEAGEKKRRQGNMPQNWPFKDDSFR